MATGLVNGKGQFSIPYRIDTPQLITKKFVAGNYVGNHYGYTKFGARPPTGGLLGEWVKYNINYFYLFGCGLVFHPCSDAQFTVQLFLFTFWHGIVPCICTCACAPAGHEFSRFNVDSSYCACSGRTVSDAHASCFKCNVTKIARFRTQFVNESRRKQTSY